MVMLLFIGALTFAQAPQKPLSISKHRVTLVDIFKEIKKQAGYDFVYSDELIKKARPLDIDVKNRSLEEVLQVCFKDQPFTYAIKNKTVIITPLNESPRIVSNTQLTVKGQVLGEHDTPLPGASVRVKDSNGVTRTDAQGFFSIVADSHAILQISYMGYHSKEVVVEGIPPVISLQVSENSLDDVQIIAYGSTSRRLNTGNVSMVTSKDIETQPVTNVMQALEGRVPGLVVTQQNGLPGAGMNVRIRGRNSIGASNNPLYVIDGVPYTSDVGLTTFSVSTFVNASPMNSINPNDIESISVLKDADATAIYGSRGANGVILITTKKGKQGKNTLNVGLDNGYGSVTRTATPLSTEQYLQVRRDAITNTINSGVTPNPSGLLDVNEWDPNLDNNLQDWYIGNTTHVINTSASVSGGTESINYLLSGNYHQESSIFSANDRYRRGNFHVNVGTVSANKKLRLNFSGTYGLDNNRLQNNGASTLLEIARSIPNYPYYNPDGSYNWTNTNYLARSKGYWKNNTNNLIANLGIDYELIQGLHLKANMGYNKLDNQSMNALPAPIFNPAQITKGQSQFSASFRDTYLIEPQVNYKVNVLGGTLDVLAGATLQSAKTNSNFVSVIDYIDDLLIESQSGGKVSSVNSGLSKYNFSSIFGRLNYNLDNTYLINATFRRDGSSRFGPGNLFANFGSIGAAWIFSSYDWIKEHYSWLSHGKLRGSYGSTGSDGIGDYQYLNIYQNMNVYGSTTAITPVQIPNPYFRWEVTKKLEFGLDLGFLQDRVLLSAVWYRNRSGSQLITFPLPSTTGFSGYVANLPALVQNTGWEFEINTKNIEKNSFNWSTSFNITIPKNKLLDFPDIETSPYAGTLVLGQSLSTVLGYRFLGIDPATGETQVADTNNDGVLTGVSSYNNQGGDYVMIGNLDPKWYGGFGNNVSYKNFQLDIFFQFTKQLGYNLYSNGFPTFGWASNVWTSHLDYWKQPGDVASLPKPMTVSNLSAQRFYNSDRKISDASFLRLKTVSLSYNLPAAWSKKIGLDALSVYAQGQNLWTLTNYIGYDPENSSGLSVAIPPLKTLTFGLKAKL